MSQEFQRTEGLVLRVIPFRDYDQILTLFTPNAGMIKLIYKGSRSKRRSAQGSCIPLTKVEAIYQEKKGEIFSCHELTLQNSYLFLRKELSHLEVACDLLQVLFSSQLVGKAAPRLYELICFYLNKIPQIFNPWVLSLSFRLKLLKHDGLTAFPLVCSECQQLLLAEAYIGESESWCREHYPLSSQHWKQHELEQLYRLAICQSYQEIKLEQVSLEMKNKVFDFFENCLKR